MSKAPRGACHECQPHSPNKCRISGVGPGNCTVKKKKKEKEISPVILTFLCRIRSDYVTPGLSKVTWGRGGGGAHG